MGYIRKKNRSKKRKSNKNRSKKRTIYNKKRYLKGGVGSPVSSNRSTPSAASASVSSTPYNSSFSTPSSNSTSSSAYSTPVGINWAGQFNDAHQQQQLSDNRNTGNYNSVGQYSPNSTANEYMNPNVK